MDNTPVIRTHYEACRYLGIPGNATKDVWKTAYRELCHKYHPDVISSQLEKLGISDEQKELERKKYEQYFIAITKAYEYLENEKISPVLIPNQANSSPKSKIIGNTKAYENNHAEYLKKQEILRKKRMEEQLRRQEELQRKAKELHQSEKERKILDQIRWLRVSEIIHSVMEEDKKKQEALKALEKEISLANNNS